MAKPIPKPIPKKEELAKYYMIYEPSKMEVQFVRYSENLAKKCLFEMFKKLSTEWTVSEERVLTLLPFGEPVKMAVKTEAGDKMCQLKLVQPTQNGDPLALVIKLLADHKKDRKEWKFQLPWREIAHGSLDDEEILASMFATNSYVEDEPVKVSLTSKKAPKEKRRRRKNRPDPIRDMNVQNENSSSWIFMCPEIYEGFDY